MAAIQRHSPVTFDAEPQKTELRDNWNIVLAYDNEGPGPWLVDLSHKTRWDYQDSRLNDAPPSGLSVPVEPGGCHMAENRLINRMNGTQASIWHLADAAPLPDSVAFTDVTEATVFLAILGSDTFRIAEKLTALDFSAPEKTTPFLLQGPFCHVPCQTVALAYQPDLSGGLLLTCSRGYAESMVDAILGSGSEFDLRPAGENRFTDWLRLSREQDKS